MTVYMRAIEQQGYFRAFVALLVVVRDRRKVTAAGKEEAAARN